MYDYNKCKKFLEKNNFVIIGDEISINTYCYYKEKIRVGEYYSGISLQKIVNALNGVLKRQLDQWENVIFTILLNNCGELKKGVWSVWNL